MPLASLQTWMLDAFVRAFPEAELRPEDVQVVPSTNPDFGDYQCNNALNLAKLLKCSPRDVAAQVRDQLAENPDVAGTDIAGPGFINIRLTDDAVVEAVTDLAGGGSVSLPDVGGGHTVVIDYSSPNVAKPMHVGHIRSTIIGHAIAQMYRALGYRVISDNHIGDWGTQFGILIMGYKHLRDDAALAENPVEALEKLYVQSYEKSRADDAWLQSCREELVKLQQGDAENRALWEQFVSWSLGEFEKIYRRLGVSFDLVRGESHYNDALPDVLGTIESKGLLAESEGAQVVFLDEEKLPVCIVRKSDGGFNYATTDIATVMSRIAEFDPDRIIYVTDERQQLHFRQFFTICGKLGLKTPLDHVYFGLMRLPEGTFSSREGNVIKLESLLDEAERRALEIVKASSPEMSADESETVARAVGIGAVKYADLSQNPQTVITFTWDKALALDGNSGPYLQYACARIASVRTKYCAQYPDKDPDTFPLALTEDVERALAVKLIRYPEVVQRAAETFKPNLIADFLYDIAQTYSTFYQNVPFLKAEEGTRESRVRLCGYVRTVLQHGLGLLGIETPDRI